MLLTLGCLPNGLSLFSLFSNSARGYLERPTNVVRGDFRPFRGVGGLLAALFYSAGLNKARMRRSGLVGIGAYQSRNLTFPRSKAIRGTPSRTDLWNAISSTDSPTIKSS